MARRLFLSPIGGARDMRHDVTLLAAAALSCMTLAGCEVLEDELNPFARDTTNDNLALAAAAAAPVTPPLSVPTAGSATYDGVVAASVSGDYIGSLYADLAMTVDFGTGTVSGQVSHADLVDDNTGSVVQNLDGTLTVVGGQAGGVVTATASGVLAATSSGPLSGTGTANLGLSGDVRSDTSTADTVYGTATGAISGGIDLDLSNGEFYGTTN
jgi:hypothetical protein